MSLDLALSYAAITDAREVDEVDRYTLIVVTPHGSPIFHLRHEDARVEQEGISRFNRLIAACGMGIDSDTRAEDFVGLKLPRQELDRLLSHRDVDEYVYVMSCDAGVETLCKIGIAASPERRLRQIRTASPHMVRLEFARRADKARQIEASAHSHFSEQRRNGEWFSLPAATAISHINSAIDTEAA